LHNLTALNWIFLLAAVFTVACFYSSVGHGGPTACLAALAPVGVAPPFTKVAVRVANLGSVLAAVLIFAGGKWLLESAA
jgi:hypothetical protein